MLDHFPAKIEMLCEMLVGMLDRLTSNVGSLSNININVMRNVGWNVGSFD